ncbi:Protein ANTAGONIST OF LIKE HETEROCHROMATIN PROTEIN 1 [Frankliniella fusca]|uniref:Protein ANTAGONIST OF LIKE HETEROCHROMATIN PROTEIN 1 n=1 Tax=Frankliniella fusca TaxID=407009 RepID=A0AAE1LSN0_9NEOP|nr:Protein ANTAGONIST OF LIKE HETEROCHROMATIN PROTEIN 1 [Frankliniella fusca]
MEDDFEALAVLAIHIINQQNQQFMAMMMAAARVAANEVMELEDDFGGLNLEEMGDWWVKVTVNLDDYHTMGDPCFQIHFRMTRTVFEILVTTVKGHLIENERLKRERTPFQDIMLMVVWLLATPDSFRSVSLRFGVNPGTLYYFYFYVIEALRQLAPKYITWPDADERAVIKATWERATGFPGIIGSIDGTHVPITAPLVDAPQYTNRHDTYSINVQAVVDSTLLVRHLHVGEVGSMHDSRVFRRSPLFKDLLISPPGQFISNDEHLVGDGAYTPCEFVMVPFRNNGHLNGAQLNYNRKLSQSRVRVENAFARAKGKWRRLKFLHARKQEVVIDHITASFVLHNFVILHGEPIIDDEELARPIHANEVLGNEEFEGDDGDEEFEEENPELAQLFAASHATGLEKRLMYMDHVLAQ